MDLKTENTPGFFSGEIPFQLEQKASHSGRLGYAGPPGNALLELHGDHDRV